MSRPGLGTADDRLQDLERRCAMFERLLSSVTLDPAQSVVRPLALWKGKLDGAMSAGGSATVSLWAYDANATALADTGKNVTAYDWMLASGGSISSGIKVTVAYTADGRWWVIAAECEE